MKKKDGYLLYAYRIINNDERKIDTISKLVLFRVSFRIKVIMASLF